MNSRETIRHEFVEFIPDALEEGALYVSIPYTTAAHLCACGCGHEVVTPLSPTDWQLIFDGETVSLKPSIGNWSFPCQSHYWIERNHIRWAPRWSREQIDAGREHDRLAKAVAHRVTGLTATRRAGDRRGFMRRMFSLLSGRRTRRRSESR
jgi:Family of unknown function (DUF6527)